MGLVVLLLQSLVMGVGSFFMGSLPLSLSKQRDRQTWMHTHAQLVSTFSVGVLISTALSVVIPEGVSVVLRSVQSGKEGEREGEVHEHLEDSDEDSVGGWIGLALVAGFLLMFCIHQLAGHYGHSPVASAPHKHYHHPMHRKSGDAKALLEDGNNGSNNSSSNGNGIVNGSPKETAKSSPISRADDYFGVASSAVSAGGGNDGVGESAINGVGGPAISSSSSSSGVPSSISPSLSERTSGILDSDPLEPTSPAFSTFVGLLFHALADGISLGAASMSSNQLPGSTLGDSSGSGLSFVIFVSLLIHKAPVAFSLTTLLVAYMPAMSRAVHAQIKRALVLFSLATPAGAIMTWLILKIVTLASWSDSMDESAEEDGNIEGIVGGNMRGKLDFWTGMALLFSAGTFLFVSTHVMAEMESLGSGGSANTLPSSHSDDFTARHRKRTKMSVFLAGMATPLLLTTILGHHVH